MDEEYEYDDQMESIGGDSIAPDGSRPIPRRGRKTRQQDAVSLGPTKPILSSLKTRSSKTNVPLQHHQQNERPLIQRPQGHLPSDLQHSVAFSPRVTSTEYSIASSDSTPETHNRETVSKGANGRKPSPRGGRMSSSRQEQESLGETRPIRKKLSRRSLQSDTRSVQSSLRHQEADRSSSQYSEEHGRRQTHTTTFASDQQHSLAFIPEKVKSSDYSVASTDATTEALYQKGLARELASDAVSIGADGRPPRRRRWRISSRQDAESLGETRPIGGGLTTRSLQSDTRSVQSSLRHQEADRSSSRGSQEHGRRKTHTATFSSDLQHSLAFIPERVTSSDYTVATTDATTEGLYQKRLARDFASDAVSIGADGRPPRRRRWRISGLTTRSLQSDTRSLQSDTQSLQGSFRHRESDWSSSQGSQGSGIRHSRQATRAPALPHDLRLIPERMTSSEYSLASTDSTIETLKQKGFSSGLARALAANATTFANRIWVVDNSGSMVIPDGHRIVHTFDGNMTETRVSRWDELQDTILYHAEMAGILNSPTVFRLLNDPGRQVGPQELSVAQDPPGVGNVKQDILRIRTVIQQAQPIGVTPLTSHILQIQKALSRMAPRLRREGKRVAVVLATDGLPTDEEGYGGDEITREFVRALKSLKGLPIRLVIRLCTDKKKVTEFYNSLDGKFDLPFELVNDFFGEAHEVHRHNKWLNYSMQLHRCRELGYHDRLLDLIHDRPLTRGELRIFCGLLFGFELSQIPDPHTDWKDFATFVATCVELEPYQYNTMKKKMSPLINVRALNNVYGKRGCTIM